MDTRHKSGYKSGFTFVELLIVISIIAVISSIGGMAYLSFRNKERVDVMANRITADIRATMARAQAQENGEQWGIHFDNTTPANSFYAIWDGESYLTGTVVQKVGISSAGVSFSNPALGNFTDLVFTKPNGLPASQVSITIDSSAALISPKTVSIDTNGTLTTN